MWAPRQYAFGLSTLEGPLNQHAPGEMREPGVSRVIIACADRRCSHSTTALADGWPGDLRLSDIEDYFIRRAGAVVPTCGLGQAPMGTSGAWLLIPWDCPREPW